MELPFVDVQFVIKHFDSLLEARNLLRGPVAV